MTPDTIRAHLPWAERHRFLAEVLKLGLAPEFALKAADLDGLRVDDVDEIADRCARTSLRPTVHAPFFDLNPGALDPLVRQVTLQRLQHTLHIATLLDAGLVVIHPGYDPWRYPGMEDLWLSQATSFFKELLELDRHGRCLLAIENIYEPNSQTLVRLVREIDSPRCGHCFDIGHWNLFGRMSLESWLQDIACHLFHLHLHDNAGTSDAHLPIGDGGINFQPLLKLLAGLASPPSVTLEAHSLPHLRRSYQQWLHLLASFSS